jgi:hypothetical protein
MSGDAGIFVRFSLQIQNTKNFRYVDVLVLDYSVLFNMYQEKYYKHIDYFALTNK